MTAVATSDDRTGRPLVGRRFHEEYLLVTTETANDATVITFKIATDASAALAAKIEFARKRLAQRR
jgi:hypothetical protein